MAAAGAPVRIGAAQEAEPEADLTIVGVIRIDQWQIREMERHVSVARSMDLDWMSRSNQPGGPKGDI